MNERICGFRMDSYGFTKKMNLWIGNGVTLDYLSKACVWKVSMVGYDEVDVKTYQDIFDYISNPRPKITSKVKY